MRKGRKKELVPFEKSKRVIYLENRGRVDSVMWTLVCAVLAILGVLCILYCAAVAMVGYGTHFFLVWGFAGVICLVFAIILRSQRVRLWFPGWLKRVTLLITALAVVIFCWVEILIASQFQAIPQPSADYCIILGAQWKESGPSDVLRRRLDAAVTYLVNNPDTSVIVSGGQGANEPIAEAVGMQEYLIGKGIAKERIRVEDKSTSTYENLLFSKNYLNEENDTVVVVTNNFHVFRALGIAKKQGYTNVEGLSASSVPGLIPNNMLREFFGVIKDFLMGNMGW